MIRVLHFTAMWPTGNFPQNGIFVKNLVEGLRKCSGLHDVLFIPAYRSKFEYIKAFYILKKLLRTKQYDLIHAQYAHCALIAGLVSRVAVIGHFHGEFGYGRYINKDYKDNLIAKFASRIIIGSIVVNPSDLKRAHSKYKAAIPIGVDTKLFYPMDRIKACQLLDWKPDSLKVLFPSDPKRPEKKYELFNRVIKKLRLNFPDLEEIILNNILYEKVPLYMNAVDLMLLTSKTEASATVIKEANACNLPVVSTPVGDARQQLQGVKNCVIVNPNGDEIFNAAIDILKKRERSNGRVKIKSYSINSTIDEVLKFYKVIMGDNKN